MLTTRIAKTSKPKPAAHTIKSIITKLNSDLSDAERENFLKILVTSADTLALLDDVISVWREQQQDAFITSSKLKKKIGQEGAVTDQLINLSLHQLTFEMSTLYAEKSLSILDKLLSEEEQRLETEYQAQSHGI